MNKAELWILKKGEAEGSRWATQRVKGARDGDMLDLGITHFAYGMYPSTKTLVALWPDELPQFQPLHNKVVKVFKGIGWRVRPSK